MKRLSVAVAWNQSHYLSLRGFHPLYSGLFEAAPSEVTINAWDNVALQRQLTSCEPVRQWLLEGLHKQTEFQEQQGFSAEDRQLTQQLPGDIELFHAIPFPSLTRPFVLLLESLHALFTPWLMGSSPLSIQERLPQIRAYYRNVLCSPWCLGVFGHQAAELGALRDFLGAAELESRQFITVAGLPPPSGRNARLLPDKPALCHPRFLFVVPEGHSADFFTCGGHRALRFWQAFAGEHAGAMLYMACERPAAALLAAAGVDNAFVEEQTGHSICWASAAPEQTEALMAGCHILLLPADLLCTFEILRAMSLGCVPVIAALIGAATLVEDNVQGLTVGREAVASEPWELPRRTAQDEAALVEALLRRIPALLASPQYAALQQAGHQRSLTTASAEAFARSFWPRVQRLHADSSVPARPTQNATPNELTQCLLDAEGWRRAFRSEARPRLRINTGFGSVWSLGGDFALLEGCPHRLASQWSVLAPYSRGEANPPVLARSLPELLGRFLPQPEGGWPAEPLPVVRRLSHLLMRFPDLHSRCAHWLRQLRRLRALFAARQYHGELLLVVDGFHGFNIISYDGLYHAVLQSDGALTPKRLAKGRYRRSYSDPDLEAVKRYILGTLTQKKARSAPGFWQQRGTK